MKKVFNYKIYATIKTIYWILKYGIYGACERADKELKDVKYELRKQRERLIKLKQI